MAEDLELHIPDAITRMLPLLCFHLDPFRSSGFCRAFVAKRPPATCVPALV
jgi:hypothetical protein